MSQHSLNTDVNTALAALGSTMKGPGVPPAPLAGMLWLDDSATPWTLRIYDGTDWILVGTVDAATNVFIADGLAAGRFFAPRANDTPNMKLRLNAGIVFEPRTQTLTGVVSQETATLAAPSANPRKDIVYIDRLTGILGVATGTEAASPVDPAVPAGKLPVARLNWTVGATAITTGMIDDIRVLNALGLGALAVQNFITDVPENFSLSGFLTPPAITATQNNYNPSGLATVSTLRLSANAAQSVTGLAGGTNGRILIVHNIGANNIALETEHAGSSASNRFALNADITLAFNQAAILQYDHVSQRWRAIAYQPTGTAPGGLSRSLRFNSADSTYLNRAFVAGSTTRFTYSTWLKRGNFGDGALINTNIVAQADEGIYLTSGDALLVGFWNNSGVTDFQYVQTNALFRDPSAWYHLVVAVNLVASTSSDRIRLFVNGIEVTSFSVDERSSLPTTFTAFNTNKSHLVGKNAGNSSGLFNGCMTATHFIDGQALNPTAFGEFDENGTWMPKEYEGTYGTNGFWLDFSDNSGTTSTTLGKDRSGNNNDWTPNNFSVSAGPGNDSLIDLPVNYDDGGTGRGNYATLNVLDKAPGGTYSNGNLSQRGDASSVQNAARTTILLPSAGKWIAELTTIGTMGSGNFYFGLWATEKTFNGNNPGATSAGFSRLAVDDGGSVQSEGISASLTLDGGFTINGGHTVHFEWDADTPQFAVRNKTNGKNAVWTAFSIPAPMPKSFVMLNGLSAGTAQGCEWNFGQRPFAYPAPSGFKALNTQNLPAPAIAKPRSYVNPVLYTGNGSTQTINGVGFQPSLVWVKSRSNALDHKLTDAIRGATKGLESDTTDAESTDTNGVTAFNTDGFALGSDATYNTNAATYVAWNWKTGVTPGFDILSYTGDGNSGRTVSHGLGVAPAFVIVKNRTDASTDWAVWHQALANTEGLNLNTQTGKFTTTTYWNSTTPGGSVLTLGNSALVNANTKSYVAYLWAEVPSFSKFGSYTGNGSSDGPFIWCGFRPELLIYKRIDTGTFGWRLYDGTRDPYNAVDNQLAPNGTDVDTVVGAETMDFVANGVKLRGTENGQNANSGTFIFAAFAEHPFKTARAR